MLEATLLQFFPFIQSETTTDLLTSRLTAPLTPEFRVSYLALLYIQEIKSSNLRTQTDN